MASFVDLHQSAPKKMVIHFLDVCVGFLLHKIILTWVLSIEHPCHQKATHPDRQYFNHMQQKWFNYWCECTDCNLSAFCYLSCQALWYCNNASYTTEVERCLSRVLDSFIMNQRGLFLWEDKFCFNFLIMTHTLATADEVNRRLCIWRYFLLHNCMVDHLHRLTNVLRGYHTRHWLYSSYCI